MENSLIKSDYFKLNELSGNAILIEDRLGDFVFDYINKIIIERTDTECNGYPMTCQLYGDTAKIGFDCFYYLYEYLGDVALIDPDNGGYFTRITRIDILNNSFNKQEYEVDYNPNLHNCLLKPIFI